MADRFLDAPRGQSRGADEQDGAHLLLMEIRTVANPAVFVEGLSVVRDHCQDGPVPFPASRRRSTIAPSQASLYRKALRSRFCMTTTLDSGYPA